MLIQTECYSVAGILTTVLYRGLSKDQGNSGVVVLANISLLFLAAAVYQTGWSLYVLEAFTPLQKVMEGGQRGENDW